MDYRRRTSRQHHTGRVGRSLGTALVVAALSQLPLHASMAADTAVDLKVAHENGAVLVDVLLEAWAATRTGYFKKQIKHMVPHIFERINHAPCT